MSDTNKAGITGKITAAPKPLELFGRRDAFTAHIAVCRNSGLTDDVKIVFTRSAIDTAGHEQEMQMPFFDNEDLLTIGKDVIIIDDMISSGSSMIDTAKQLKSMGAKRVFICTTFGLFTNGMDKFDEGYEKKYFDAVITTNLTYMDPEITTRPYLFVADMGKFLATIIDFLNHDATLASVNMPTDKIREIVSKYNSGCKTPDELFD